MLTVRQSELLAFLIRRQQECPVSPSFLEMSEALGLKSKSGIHRLLGALEERGFIRRLPNRSRALEVLRHPWEPPPDPKVTAVDALLWAEAHIRVPGLAGRIVEAVLSH